MTRNQMLDHLNDFLTQQAANGGSITAELILDLLERHGMEPPKIGVEMVSFYNIWDLEPTLPEANAVAKLRKRYHERKRRKK